MIWYQSAPPLVSHISVVGWWFARCTFGNPNFYPEPQEKWSEVPFPFSFLVLKESVHVLKAGDIHHCLMTTKQFSQKKWGTTGRAESTLSPMSRSNSSDDDRRKSRKLKPDITAVVFYTPWADIVASRGQKEQHHITESGDETILDRK